MKRFPSPTSSPFSPSAPYDSSTTPSPKKPKPSPKNTQSGSGSGASVGSAEKHAILVEELMLAGMEHVDKTALAEKLGVTKKQLHHQLEPNRSNIRKRILDWARGGISDKP